MTESQIPIGDALRGVTITSLPDGWTPLESLCMVKCLDEDGKPKWAFRMSDGINDEEMLGAMVLHTEMFKKEMMDDWVGD